MHSRNCQSYIGVGFNNIKHYWCITEKGNNINMLHSLMRGDSEINKLDGTRAPNIMRQCTLTPFMK